MYELRRAALNNTRAAAHTKFIMNPLSIDILNGKFNASEICSRRELVCVRRLGDR